MSDSSGTSPRDRAIGQRPWIWVVYGALFALSIPWYLPADETPTLWFGIPYWVVLSLAAAFAISCFTAFVIRCYWRDPPDSDQL